MSYYHERALMLEFGGALTIAWYGLKSLFCVVSGAHSISGARFVLAEGVVTGLGIKVIATLLKTIELRTWREIGMFALVLSLRTLLKTLFEWERRRISDNNSRAV